MRCKFCDFSKDTPSGYYEGLHSSENVYTVIKRDRITGDYVCSECADVIEKTYEDTLYRSKEDLNWDQPSRPRIFNRSRD